MFPPQRIVCLTEETVETLYLLGEQDRIVGISGYVVRPPQARREKPRVSAFTSFLNFPLSSRLTGFSPYRGQHRIPLQRCAGTTVPGPNEAGFLERAYPGAGPFAFFTSGRLREKRSAYGISNRRYTRGRLHPRVLPSPVLSASACRFWTIRLAGSLFSAREQLGKMQPSGRLSLRCCCIPFRGLDGLLHNYVVLVQICVMANGEKDERRKKNADRHQERDQRSIKPSGDAYKSERNSN